MQVRNIFKVSTSPQGILFSPVKGLNKRIESFDVRSGSFVEVSDQGVNVVATFEEEAPVKQNKDPLSIIQKLRQLGSFF